LAVVLPIVVVGAPAPADACIDPCVQGFFVPASASTVPANLPAVYWSPIYEPSGEWPSKDKLVALSSDGIPPTFTVVAAESWRPSYLLYFEVPLVEGTTYAFVDRNECAVFNFYRPPSVTFLAGPPAPLPTTLGQLESQPSRFGLLDVPAQKECDPIMVEVVAAHAFVRLELSSDAAPWREVLELETIVDGKVFTVGAHGHSLYRVCAFETTDPWLSIYTGLEEGVHEVKMRATLPGTDLVLETRPITVEIDCPPDPTLPDPPAPAENGCATSRPSLVMLVALLLLRRRRR
jgi:hypothetical protein